jgi:hypothetical protein
LIIYQKYILSSQGSGRISGVWPLPDIRCLALGFAGYPAKTVSGTSLIFYMLSYFANLLE